MLRKWARRAVSAAMSAALALTALPAVTAQAAVYESGLKYNAYPALKEIYKDYFRVGSFGGVTISGAEIYHLQTISPGNEMKPESIQRNKGTFSDSAAGMFTTARTSAGFDYYGHTLVWQSQTPAWFWDAPGSNTGAAASQPGTYDRDTATANMMNHITWVMNKYGARLYAMDVVNEPIQNPPNPDNWKGSLAGTGWYSAMGYEYVEKAFLKAAEIVDANGWDCKLILNDFGLDNPKKAGVMYNMVKEINEKYAGTRPNGKNLIEIVGMQGHYNPATSPAAVEESIKLFATLPGIEIEFSEFDIGSLRENGALTDIGENDQAMQYAELFQIFKKYAKGPANTTDNPHVITRIAFCDLSDHASGWRGGEFASVFRSNGNAKLAMVAIVDPDAFLETHAYQNVPTENAHVPGVYVYDSEKGDPLSGADIILGNSSAVWPYSTAGEDGEVAFVPHPGEQYRITLKVTDTGAHAVRVRWAKDAAAGYTSADTAVVNNNDKANNQTATAIPTRFTGMVSMSEYTLTTLVTFDGNQKPDGLIGNISIRGNSGSSAFTINSIKIENVTQGNKLLVNWPQAIDFTKVPGIYVGNQSKGDEASFATIVLGNNADVWPYATAGDDGKVAFAPEKGGKYRISLGVTTFGTTAVRLRWTADANTAYTTEDTAKVGNHTRSATQVATIIPAYFNSGMSNGRSYTLVTEITLTGNEQPDGLIGNIAVRGGGGGNDFSINSIKIEKLNGADAGAVLVSWPGVKEAPPAAPEPTPEPTAAPEDVAAVGEAKASIASPEVGAAAIKGGNESLEAVKANLRLPATYKGLLALLAQGAVQKLSGGVSLLAEAVADDDVAITWKSSNPAVSDSGVVTRPKYGAGNSAGNLTATLTKGLASDTFVFAVTVLQETQDRTALDALLVEAAGKKQENYKAGWDAFDGALTAAKAIGDDSSQAQVDAAAAALKNAMAALQAKDGLTVIGVRAGAAKAVVTRDVTYFVTMQGEGANVVEVDVEIDPAVVYENGTFEGLNGFTLLNTADGSVSWKDTANGKKVATFTLVYPGATAKFENASDILSATFSLISTGKAGFTIKAINAARPIVNGGKVTAQNAPVEVAGDENSVEVEIVNGYKVILKADKNGSVNTGESGEYGDGEVINLTAAADHGYKFKEWKVNGVGAVADAKSAATTFTVGKGDATITATFEKVETPVTWYQITVEADEHGSVDTAGGKYVAGDMITITATPDEGYVFSSWSFSGTSLEIVSGNASTATVTVRVGAASETITAKFEQVVIIPGGGMYDLNDDGAVDLLDLSIAAMWYQYKAGDDNWKQAKAADFNEDGVVNLVDLTMLYLHYTSK